MKKQKSPSFSFYSADFLVGTTSMTDKQVGQYIRLLCLQHQSSDGKLTKQEVMNILKKDDPIVLRKFSIDENGLYFNERLLDEIAKREEYLKSQRDKINKRWHKDNDTEDIPNEYNGNTKVIPLEIENEVVIKNEFKDDLKDSIKIIIDYLNLKTNKHFKHTTDETVKFIRGRLNEKYTLEQFQHVIDVKCEEWLGTDHEKYLTPSTLFRPANFEKYVNQKRDAKKQMNDWAYKEYKKTGDLL